MRTKLPTDPDQQRFFIERMLTDTGFFAREVLGMDTDKDGNGNATSEVGKGGIRDWGPHKLLTEFMDDDSISHGIVMCPRYSYKSSAVEAFIARKILQRPNIAILLMMADAAEARKRCRQIRDMLQNNPIVQELYGDVKGPVWKDDQFVTAMRTDDTLQSPTLWVGSPQKGVAGGRPNIVIFDDIVNETNSRTENGLKRGRETVEAALSLGSRDERYLMVCTPWHPADAAHFAMDAGWKKLAIDVGYDIVERPHETDPAKMVLDLAGEGNWPNLKRDFLAGKLRGGMTFQVFMSQFKLRCVTGVTQAIRRDQFQPCIWQEEKHRDLTGYLLTDVAPSGSPKGDFNVLLYVGLDERNRVYILDCEIGHWKMYEFCDRYLAMLQKWQTKVNHRHEMWEKSLNYHAYHQHIHVKAKERNVRVQFHGEARNSSAASKDFRIGGMQIRFQAGDVFVMSTCPRTWTTGTELRLLWAPDGFVDETTKVAMPGGDLVEQFVRWPHHAKKDLPDTLALLDTVDKASQQRVCFHVKPARHRQTESVMRKPVARQSAYHGSSSRFYSRVQRGRLGRSDS